MASYQAKHAYYQHSKSSIPMDRLVKHSDLNKVIPQTQTHTHTHTHVLESHTQPQANTYHIAKSDEVLPLSSELFEGFCSIGK